jgi:hypothetical protein
MTIEAASYNASINEKGIITHKRAGTLKETGVFVKITKKRISFKSVSMNRVYMSFPITKQKPFSEFVESFWLWKKTTGENEMSNQ